MFVEFLLLLSAIQANEITINPSLDPDAGDGCLSDGSQCKTLQAGITKGLATSEVDTIKLADSSEHTIATPAIPSITKTLSITITTSTAAKLKVNTESTATSNAIFYVPAAASQTTFTLNTINIDFTSAST